MQCHRRPGGDRDAHPSSYDCLIGDVSVAEAARPAGPDNLWLVPANRDLAGAAVELPRLDGSETRLRERLGPLRERFAFTMLDCPPSLGPVSVNALVASDRVIVPVQAEYLALEGLVQFLDTLGMIRRELNPALNVSGLLITMHDERTRLAQDVERELREHFPEMVFDTVIPRSVRVAEAPSYGLPVTEHAPASRGADRLPGAGRGAGRAWLAARRKRGMGRGLAAILPESAAGEDVGELRELPVGLIKPNPKQPRTNFDADALAGLAASIETSGVVQPLLVRPLHDGSYELIAGERRWRAAQQAGLEKVPAIVRDSEQAERLQVALIENMVREDLNPVEEARACAALVEDLGLSKEDLARRVGRSRPAVSNLIRLLDLPDEAIELLESGELSEGHGRALLGAPGNDVRRRLARDAAKGGWSVRETENRVKLAGQPKTGRRRDRAGRRRGGGGDARGRRQAGDRARPRGEGASAWGRGCGRDPPRRPRRGHRPGAKAGPRAGWRTV